MFFPNTFLAIFITKLQEFAGPTTLNVVPYITIFVLVNNSKAVNVSLLLPINLNLLFKNVSYLFVRLIFIISASTLG